MCGRRTMHRKHFSSRCSPETRTQRRAPSEVFSQVLWRTARAKICARRGELKRAEALAREAVRLAEQTDLLNAQADALLDLSEVLTLAGRPEEARVLVEESARRYRRKGNLPSLERARQSANELALARSRSMH